MKTRNNLKAVALIIAVVLTAGNVSATKKTTKASGHENIIESSLSLEAWMTDENIWNTTDNFIYTEEQEAALNIESWMTDSDVWSTASEWANQVEEPSLNIEAWMTDEYTWEFTPDLVFETEKEADLNIENWMINDIIWRI
ncbi:MAG TPA: hypothetical protein VEP89_08575 [Draconibacterium sp.]|nr:hypothetical protein [Draconibacterium sp.]